MLSDCDEVQPSHPSHQDQIAEYRLKRAKAAARDGSAIADRDVVAPASIKGVAVGFSVFLYLSL